MQVHLNSESLIQALAHLLFTGLKHDPEFKHL